MQKYLLINPFDPTYGNGVNSYYQSVKAAIGDGVEFHEFSNTKNENLVAFRQSVLKYVEENFKRDEVVIEAPETRAATLLLDRSWKVHIRLHTALGVCEKYEGKTITQGRFSDELRVIAQAAVVSAPSYGIAREVGLHLNDEKFIVNKNPILKEMPYIAHKARGIDVLFMGRHQSLKGSQYLSAFLKYIPEQYRLMMVGTGATKHPLLKEETGRVMALEHIEGDGRFDVLANARVAIIPSLFENCSMMMLEAIAAGVPVVAWNVGGNDEFPTDLVKTIGFDNIDQFAKVITEEIQGEGISRERSVQVVKEINEDFVSGLYNAVELANRTGSVPHRSKFRPNGAYHPRRAQAIIRNPEELFTGKRVFGFTISNEHIEEMWGPILHYTGVDYKLACKRPLGFHSKFRDKFTIEPRRFSQYDWIRYPDKLIDDIVAFKPHVLLTHNGSHPIYQKVMARVRELRVPIIYTELGWFPQDGNIYIDRHGSNAFSSLAKMDFQSLTGKDERLFDKMSVEELHSRDIFLAVQLNNDTNIKVASPRFRSADEFVEYIISQTPDDRKIYLKPHPLDPLADRFDTYLSEKVEIVDRDTPASEILGKVGHVAALNSTVLLEALSYPINIYAGGMSILDGKGVTIDLKVNEFSEVLSDEMHGSRLKREAVIRGFKKRQINLLDLASRNMLEDGDLISSLVPLAEAVMISAPVWPAPKAAPSAAAPVSLAKAPDPKKAVASPAAAGVRTADPAKKVDGQYLTLYKSGVSHYRRKEYALALQILEKAIDAPHSAPDALRLAAECQIRLGEEKDAVRLLQRAAETIPLNKNLQARLRYLTAGTLKRISLPRSEFQPVG